MLTKVSFDHLTNFILIDSNRSKLNKKMNPKPHVFKWVGLAKAINKILTIPSDYP